MTLHFVKHPGEVDKAVINNINYSSKIGFDGEEELIYKYALENCDVVLLVKHQHVILFIAPNLT